MPHQAKHHADKQSKPRPGPYYHLKCFALAFAGLLVFLIVVRLLWGWEAHRRLQAEIDRIVARGEPLFPEDFNPSEEIPDDQNAAILYTKAAKPLNLTTEQSEFLFWDSTRLFCEEWTDREWQIVADIAEASSEPGALASQARALPGVDWGLQLESPALDWWLPGAHDLQLLARALRITALHQYHAGDHAAAVETVRDILALTEAVSTTLHIGLHTAPVEFDRPALRTLKDILPGLQIATSAYCEDDGSIPAEREELEQLMAMLLDGSILEWRTRRAIHILRMAWLDTAQVVAAGKLSFLVHYSFAGDATVTTQEKILAYPVAPLFEMKATRMLKRIDAVLQSCIGTNAPAVDEALRPFEGTAYFPLSMPSRILRPLQLSFGVSGKSLRYFHYQPLDDRYQAAIALAVRLYELDHGRRPETLADLVPNYLPEVPIAPLLEGDQRYTYGDLSILLLDPQSESEEANSKEAGGDEDKVDDGQRQDGKRGDGGSNP